MLKIGAKLLSGIGDAELFIDAMSSNSGPMSDDTIRKSTLENLKKYLEDKSTKAVDNNLNSSSQEKGTEKKSNVDPKKG